MSLGENIKNARIKKNMSQKELAEAISTDEETYGNTSISNWENNINKPDADTIALLCKVLDVDANYLLDLDNIKSEKARFSDPIETLYDKAKDILSDDDKETMRFIMQKTIDKYEKSKSNNI